MFTWMGVGVLLLRLEAQSMLVNYKSNNVSCPLCVCACRRLCECEGYVKVLCFSVCQFDFALE